MHLGTAIVDPRMWMPSAGQKRYLAAVLDPSFEPTPEAKREAARINRTTLWRWAHDPRFVRWMREETETHYRSVLNLAYQSLAAKAIDGESSADVKALRLLMERFDPAFAPLNRVQTDGPLDPSGVLAKVLSVNAQLATLCDKRGITGQLYRVLKSHPARQVDPTSPPLRGASPRGGTHPPVGPASDPSAPLRALPPPAVPPSGASPMPQDARTPSSMSSEPISASPASPGSNSASGSGGPIPVSAPVQNPAPDLKSTDEPADVGDALEDVPLVRKMNGDGTPACDEDGNPLYIPKYPTQAEIGAPRQVVDEEGDGE